MWITLIAIAAVCVVALVVVRVALVGQRPRHEAQPVVVDPADADEFPAPGEPTPRRADGSVPPGSRDDRARKRPDTE